MPLLALAAILMLLAIYLRLCSIHGELKEMNDKDRSLTVTVKGEVPRPVEVNTKPVEVA